MTTAKLQAILNKIQNLLDLADHPNTPEHEANLARDKAASMMAKYRIEEEQVRVQSMARGTDVKPVVESMQVCDYSSPFMVHYWSLLYYIAEYTGVRVTSYTDRVMEDGTERWKVMAYVVGFDSDIAYTQLLYTHLRLHFSGRLEPKYDPSLSDEVNVYRLRSAGIQRHIIAGIIWGNQKLHMKVTQMYKEACAARGEDAALVGRYANAKTYRKSFADAYVGTIARRLRVMRTTAGLESGALVLAGRDKAVEDAFYERFPSLRPKPRVPAERCERCARAASGYCREHKPRAIRYHERPFSAAGMDAGQRAAETADLGGKAAGSRTVGTEGASIHIALEE